MISISKRTKVSLMIGISLLLLVAGCSTPGTTHVGVSDSPTATPSVIPSSAPSARATTTIYKNSLYGFMITLPLKWLGYSIITTSWNGYSSTSSSIIQTGPILSIRDPSWTVKVPRQEIPIMVFTLKQWSDLNRDQFNVGAAPMSPSILGKNNNYVFAIPARYNYAFISGYQEVQNILDGKPFQAFN